MPSDLLEAYEGVYVSAKEILKNKQKHLYINMLDLLTRATKAAMSSNKDHITDEYIKFWFMDIVPLIFDEDKLIQDNAISALDTALQCIDSSRLENLSEWPVIKTTIVESYPVKLHEMRQISNSNWYRAWSILIRILNKEILKGAPVINKFLSIVELGFRSSDYKTRAEAFICWKVLVQIFAKNNEIFSAKRIKLICIPLKSSQSKTLETAVNKFKAWWYFLCKLNTEIVEYHDIAFEPFLLFCFGSQEKNQAIAQCKNYPIVKEMAIAALIAMLGPSTRESECLLETTELERPEAPLITTALMMKCGKAILNASFEAMLMIAEKNSERNKYFDALWRNLLEQISKTNNIELYLEYCNHVRRLVELETIKDDKVSQHYFSYIITALGTHKMFPFEHDGTANDPQTLCRVILEITNLLRNKKIGCSIQDAEAVINNIYDIGKLKNSNKYWDVQRLLIEAVMQAKELDFYLKMIIWEKISCYLIDYLNEKFFFEFRIEQNAVVVNNWLFWLIETCDINDKINESFLDCWKKLSLAASKAEGKCNFARAISVRFKDLLEKKSQLQILPDILSSIIDSLEVEFDKSSKPVEVYELVSQLLNNAHIQSKGKETVVAATSRHINKLQENQILEAFEDFRVITATLISHSGSLTKHIFEEFKKTLSDKLKTNKVKDKKLLKEFKDLFKNNSNPFVIIPTSWSFNPDKLTEHQKEKMKEKTYIPALYNDISHDLSHSQDIIKPWTPKKIVIAKGKNSEEIVIENKIVDDEKITGSENQEVIGNNCTNISLDKSDEKADKSKENVDPSGETPNREEGNININKSVISDHPKDESEKNDKKVIRKDFEILLKKFNVEDEKKKLSVLRQLKTIEIDTVEGNTFITDATENLRRTRSSRQSNKSINEENCRSLRRNKEKESKTTIPKKRVTRKSLNFKGTEDEKTANILTKDKQEDKEQENKNNVSGDDSLDEVIGASQEPSQSVLTRKILLNNNINSPNSKKRSLNLIKSPDVIGNKPETCSENIHLGHTENADVAPVQDTCLPFIPTVGTLNEKEEKTEESKRSPEGKSEKKGANTEDSKRSPRNNKRKSEKEGENGQSLGDKTSPKHNIYNKRESEKEGENGQSLGDKTSPKENIYNKRKSEKEGENGQSLGDKTSPKHNIYEFSEEPLDTFSKDDFNCKKAITQKCSSPRLRKSPCKARFESEEEVFHNSESQPQPTKEDNSSAINAQQCDNEKLPSMEVETNETSIVNTEKNETCTAGTIQQLQNHFNESISGSSDLPNDSHIIDSPHNVLKACPMANSTNIEITDADALGDIDENVSHSDDYDKITKSTSPKKMLRLSSSSPSSPPDRKQTVNNESPAVKSKPLPQLTGRGAKFINMIRNNKFETVPKLPMNGLMSANIEKKISPQNSRQQQEIQENSPEKEEQTAVQQSVRKDLLVFSKILPSPKASPSVSILKRKIRQESFDDMDSPANKRKRVSFHDPPVSVTKEYVKHVEEERLSTPTSKRCLIPEKISTSQQQGSKQNFKRKSRVDSINEIAKFTETSTPVAEADLNHLVKDHSSLNMSSLKWNSTDNAEQGDDADLMSSPSLHFSDESSIFSFIFEKYQIEDILEKYMASGKTISGKSCKSIIKMISAAMSQEPKLKVNVLEMLSEDHPKEFLDHAIQENLSAVVCDRLNTASVLEYVSEKAKINTGMRSALLDQIPNILGDKSNTEKYEFLTSLLKSQQLSQEQVLDCIGLIMQRHKEYRPNQSNEP